MKFNFLRHAIPGGLWKGWKNLAGGREEVNLFSLILILNSKGCESKRIFLRKFSRLRKNNYFKLGKFEFESEGVDNGAFARVYLRSGPTNYTEKFQKHFFFKISF